MCGFKPRSVKKEKVMLIALIQGILDAILVATQSWAGTELIDWISSLFGV